MATKTKDVKVQKVPRHIRKQMVRDLRKAEKELTKHAFTIIGDQKVATYPENQFHETTVKLWDKDWLSEAGGDWTDPATGHKHKIRLSEVITYERGKVKIDGKLVEAVRPVSIDRKKVIKFFEKAYSEANLSECVNANLIENNTDWQGVGPTQYGAMTGDINNGKLLPYPPGPFSRQLYLNDQWKMIARATSYADYNALAKAGIFIKTAFTIGTGPKVTCTNEKVQELWDNFVEKNDFINRLKNYDRMLTTNGEFFGEIFDEKIDGEDVCKIRSIDPGTIYDIITEPRDIEKVYGYQLIYPTQYQLYGTGAKGEQVPLSEFIYETLPPENICHIKINVQENEKRGRSDLLPVMNICQYFADYLRYRILRAIVQAAFTWDIKLMNADQTDIDAIQNDEQSMFPTPMSTYVHNENVERTAVQSSGSEGAGRSTTFQEIVTAFSIGFLLNKEYMNAGDSTTRASAVTNSEPTVKIFQDRRGLWESFIRKVLFYQAAKEDIKIKTSDIEVIWPEIAPENVTEKLQNLLIGLDRGVITRKRFSDMYAKEMDIRGYDFQQEVEDMMKEANDSLLKELYPVGVNSTAQAGQVNMAMAGSAGSVDGAQPVIDKAVAGYKPKPKEDPKSNAGLKSIKAAGKP